MTAWVPMLSSSSGRTLTFKQWQTLGIQCVSYDLSALLVKPGFDILQTANDLKSYLGWPGKIILQATLTVNSDGTYVVLSPFDGSRHIFTQEMLIAAIVHLKPDAVLLPAGWKSADVFLQYDIMPFFALHDYSHDAKTGVYGTALELLAHNGLNGPRCVLDHVTPVLLKDLVKCGIDWIISETPTEDAIQGRVYTHSGETLSLQDAATAQVFAVIDAMCTCATCQDGLTEAYLHHLLQHTPLLCQRFLVCHNAVNVARDCDVSELLV